MIRISRPWHNTFVFPNKPAQFVYRPTISYICVVCSDRATQRSAIYHRHYEMLIDLPSKNSYYACISYSENS